VNALSHDACPASSPHAHRRIARAYDRMVAATADRWRHAWGDAFVALVRARNAERTEGEVRAMEKRLGLR
jgi:hypothetical protein